MTVLVLGFQLFPYRGAHGPLQPADFLAGFANPALITIVALMICAKALEVTGALHGYTRLLAGLWGRHRNYAGVLARLEQGCRQVL